MIASHPHIPQGWEVHRGKPIFYSLGNFYFDAIKNNHLYWNKGLIVELIISDDISYKVQNIIFNKNEIKIDKSESIQLHNLMLCNLLINEIDYFAYIDNQALDHWNSYRCHFKRSFNTMIFSTNLKVLVRSLINSIIGKPNVYQLVNLIRCESHRWFVIRALELLMEKRNRR